MIEASPRLCAGERDLGLSVSAWPKLASKGSQRLVSVGRAQAAAAMFFLWAVLCTREDFECRALSLGWWRASGVRCYLGDVPGTVWCLLAAIRMPAPINQSHLEALSASFKNRSGVDASLAARRSALSQAGGRITRSRPPRTF